MITVEITRDRETIAALRSLSNQANISASKALDAVADRVANYMRSRAPRGLTGELRSVIAVTQSGPLTRTIGPGTNGGTRSSPLPARYAFYVDKGNAPHWPNVEDIAQRFGTDASAAYLIARKIRDNPGPAYNFVEPSVVYARSIFKTTVQQMLAFSKLL